MARAATLRRIDESLERGRLDQALALCDRALAAEPRDPQLLCLRAQVRLRAGRVPDALEDAWAAVAAQDNDAACRDRLGEVLTAAGKLGPAIVELRRAIELRPDFAQAHLHLGQAYAASRSASAAEDAYRAALAIWPDYPEAHCALGCLLDAEGRASEAIGALEAAVRAKPAYIDAWVALAEVRASAGDRNGAYAAATRATVVAPSSVRAWTTLGRYAQASGRSADAERAFRRGLELGPDDGACLLGLAAVFEQTRRFEDAVALLRPALARSPEQTPMLTALARALFALGELSEAERLALEATKLAPRDADAHYTLGNVQLRLQRPVDALATYRRVLALSPRLPKARLAAASPLLMLGHLPAGWDAYEARLAMAEIPWKIPAPLERLWNGGPIGNQRLLVHTEQGFGDTLQFIRYLPLLRSRTGPEAKIAVLCEPELTRVVATVGGNDSLLGSDAPGAIDFDVQIPLLSLPHRFGTTLESIPASIPYVNVPAGADAGFRRPAGAKLAVAFAWAGRPEHSDDRMRSCSIERFASLFALDGVHYVSVQVGPRAADVDAYLNRPNVSSVSDRLTDLAQTLAVMDRVDLVIAVDTAVVHLAGALGKRVWTLLASGGEWRWLLEREDTPWYPTMRLFRQRTPGDWGGVFDRVRRELERMIA